MNRRPLTALAAALLLGAAQAGAAAPTPTAEDRELATPFVAWMSRVLAVPDAADLDPSLRASMSALVKEHMARLGKLLPEWVAQARERAGKAAPRGTLIRQTRNRLVNELALWRLDSPGADYDAAWLRAALKPGMCHFPKRDGYLGVVMAWLQAAPPADRATLLAGERELLSRWGKPRPTLPARPARSLSDDEDEAIARLKAGDATPDIGMAPAVASAVFAAEREPVPIYTRCSLHQWGLARALHRGDPAAASLAAWRYEMIMTAADWAGPSDQHPAATDYPPVARDSLVEGQVDVRVTTNAQGGFASATIEARRLTVPGVVGVPPVAFETLLDQASLTQAALKLKPVVPPRAGTLTMHINWRLQ